MNWYVVLLAHNSIQSAQTIHQAKFNRGRECPSQQGDQGREVTAIGCFWQLEAVYMTTHQQDSSQPQQSQEEQKPQPEQTQQTQRPAVLNPTSEEVEAVIQAATSQRSEPDGKIIPLKDTRTQLFVGNVRSSLCYIRLIMLNSCFYETASV